MGGIRIVDSEKGRENYIMALGVWYEWRILNWVLSDSCRTLWDIEVERYRARMEEDKNVRGK